MICLRPSTTALDSSIDSRRIDLLFRHQFLPGKDGRRQNPLSDAEDHACRQQPGEFYALPQSPQLFKAGPPFLPVSMLHEWFRVSHQVRCVGLTVSHLDFNASMYAHSMSES